MYSGREHGLIPYKINSYIPTLHASIISQSDHKTYPAHIFTVTVTDLTDRAQIEDMSE